MSGAGDGAGGATLPGWAEVLDFWFDAAHAPLWFKKDEAFDRAIRARFAPLVTAAVDGGLATWEDAAPSCLALLIVLDQFPRNAWRGTPRAYCGDARALAVARRALARGFDRAVPIGQRRFFYLPLEHSEDLADQEESCALFRRLAAEAAPADRASAEEQLLYAERHREIIARFGRFPHRNAILGRASTPAEVAFLAEPMSSF
ncbi:MAG: DUF924 domain-containing protein [Rhodospirillaceae bacterium]|nr:DUF924 domain-containing protein [Rhodospirillaceae bacterium]